MIAPTSAPPYGRGLSSFDPNRLLHPAILPTPSEDLARRRAALDPPPLATALPISRENVTTDELAIRRCSFCGRQMASICLATLTLRQPATFGAAERELYLCTDCKEGFERMAQRTVDTFLARCAEHASPSEISIMLTNLQWRDKENASYARGERQIRCQECASWFWPWETTAELNLHPLTTDEIFDSLDLERH